MSNYGRFLQVSAGSASYGFSGVGPEANTALRVRFTIKLFAGVKLNIATVRITNPLPATAQQFVSTPDQPITISAGYADNSGIIFSGTIRQAVYGRDNPTDTLLTLYCTDSDINHNFGVVNKSLAPGSTPQDHVTQAVQAMASAGGSLSLGYVDPALKISTPQYPKSVQLYGMARDVLDKVARLKQANWSIQQGQVQIVGYKNVMPGGPVILNSSTGLVGMPTQEIGGIMARALINPQIKIYTAVQIAQGLIQGAQQPIAADGTLGPSQIPSTAADGVYKVLGITYEGDSRGNPWYMDLTCVTPNAGQSGGGFLPSGLAAANAGPQQ